MADTNFIPRVTTIVATWLQDVNDAIYRFVQAGTGAVQRTLEDKLSDLPVTPQDFGAVGDGVANDTAAFVAAINALPVSGGEIFLPSGKYAINLTLTKDNVSFRGVGNAYDTPGSGCSLVPWSTSSPLIQVGNDTGLTTDFKLDNVCLYGLGPNGRGEIGLSLGGGAYVGWYHRLSIIGFATHCLKLSAGATNGLAYNYFDKINLQGFDTAPFIACFISEDATGGSFNAANFFGNMRIAGPAANGHAVIVSGVQPVFMDNSWIQCASLHGLQMAAGGYIVGSNVVIDSDNSADVLMEVDISTSDAKIISTWLRGGISFDGTFKLADATIIARPSGREHQIFPDFFKPVIYDSMIFRDSDDPIGYDITGPRIYGDGSGVSASLNLSVDASNATINLTAGSVNLIGGSSQILAATNSPNVVIGSGAIGTTATTRFLFITSCAGPPTGIPNPIPTGRVPLVVDSVNHKLYFYSGGAWRDAGP